MSDPYKPPASPIAAEANARLFHPAWNPITWLIVITAMISLESAWFAYSYAEVPLPTSLMWQFVFGILLAWWALRDRRSRGVGMPYEFEAFVVFAWFIALPYYLCRTRGWNGLLLGLCAWLLYLAPALAATCVHLLVAD